MKCSFFIFLIKKQIVTNQNSDIKLGSAQSSFKFIVFHEVIASILQVYCWMYIHCTKYLNVAGIIHTLVAVWGLLTFQLHLQAIH